MRLRRVRLGLAAALLALGAGCSGGRGAPPSTRAVSQEGASSGGATGSALLMNSVNPCNPGGDDAGAR